MMTKGMQTIKLYGDIFKIRKTFDIDDFLGLGISGYEVYDGKGNPLLYHQTEKRRDLIRHVKCKIYKEFAYLRK